VVEHSQGPTAPAIPTGTIWRKSTASQGTESNCIEVAMLSKLVVVRDSKDATGRRLAFTPFNWTGFLGALRLADEP
jgi:hypothetical protein